MTRICPHCGKEREARGFVWHKKACVLKILKKRYANSLATMNPKVAERFLRKAQGG